MRGQSGRTVRWRMVGAALTSLLAAILLLSCGTSTSSGGGKLQVVAAENFWGSIVQQLGGDKIDVTDIISNPDADPHSYEPTAANGRSIATADLVIVNGAGYDGWASKLIHSNPAAKRTVLDVGALLGVKDGGNPHMWYSPTYVHRVIAQMTADLKKADGADAGYFDQRRQTFESKTLATYDALQADIKQKYAGQPVGATESIFVYLARDLGLDLTTPPAFMEAISEGNEPTAQDKATFDRQIAQRQIKVLVYNKQNSTPDVDALVQKAKSEKIPVVSITETLAPAGTSFQDWQSSQLRSLEGALGQAAS